MFTKELKAQVSQLQLELNNIYQLPGIHLNSDTCQVYLRINAHIGLKDGVSSKNDKINPEGLLIQQWVDRCALYAASLSPTSSCPMYTFCFVSSLTLGELRMRGTTN